MIIIFKFFGKLPLSFLRSAGFIFSWIFWFLSKKYRFKFKMNWGIAKKHSAPLMEKASLTTAVGRACMFVFELPKIWCDKNIKEKIELVGFESLELLLSQGKGLICLSPHLGSFELVPRIFPKKIPVSILYRPSKNKFFEELFTVLRPDKNIKMVEPNFSGVKKLLVALKKGEIVGLLPDQVPPLKYGIAEFFFGKPAYTMTLASKLILMTGAPVVWVSVRHKKNGWQVTIKQWSLLKKSENMTREMTKAINEKIEELIVKEPENYFWGYDRYKTPKKISNFNYK